ncbi:hypothetical protein BKA67DRAFT_549130 [Truncatella angustata]|uniref:Uncharacterized protein n=1 Tax=Truncatella angustata TaxID=152316 RepID=A0A9P8UZ16_9PEZI|nr:uncharacterized protein BKA67DRAFT_549130 [Truncatella angustata]KAH6660773.1 hypothetical protein BKA67DRAFT_549130 [Truncatella angustata]
MSKLNSRDLFRIQRVPLAALAVILFTLLAGHNINAHNLSPWLLKSHVNRQQQYRCEIYVSSQ